MGEKVQGRCPGCGRVGFLFLATGGYITCSIAECPRPTAAADLLEMRIQPDRLNTWHTARIGRDRWSLDHPLSCDLATCKFDLVAQLWPRPPREEGTYRWDDLEDNPSEWKEA